MHAFFERLNRRLAYPLDFGPRLMLVVAGLLLVVIFLSPLWNLTLFAPQYQDGLQLDIYANRLVGGHGGQDITEINLLNHYIGMRGLVADDFTEFKWLPFVVGGLVLLYWRAAVVGTVGHVLDVLVLNLYFSTFALWSFAHRLYQYGHTLSPTAAVKVPPFMPPIFGSKQLANFTVFSYPGLASWAMAASTVLLVLAMFVAWRTSRRGVVQAPAPPRVPVGARG